MVLETSWFGFEENYEGILKRNTTKVFFCKTFSLGNLHILLEIQQWVSDPGESAAGVRYLSKRVHSKSCCILER